MNLITDNPVTSAFDARTAQLEADRANRLKLQQAEEEAQKNRAIDQAIRESFQPGAGLGTGSEQQASAIAQQQVEAPSQAPITPVSAVAPIPTQEAQPQRVSPSATGQSPSPIRQASSVQPISGATQTAELSPFDTPEFTANLAKRLATIPGAGQRILEMKKERDTLIGNVLEKAANGEVDLAKYEAKRNGLNIPEEFYSNGDFARAMSLANKAYPDEPDKGQVFVRAFLNSQGDVQSRALVALKSAGKPTNAGQRSLANSIALAKFNAEQKKQQPEFFQGQDQALVTVTPEGVVNPIKTADGQPFKPIAGKGVARSTTSAAQPKVISTATNGVLWVNPATGESKQIVAPGQRLSDSEMALRIYEKLSDAVIQKGTPEEIMAKAKEMAASLKLQPKAAGPVPTSTKTPTPPTTNFGITTQFPEEQAGDTVNMVNPTTGERAENVPASMVGEAEAEGFQVE